MRNCNLDLCLVPPSSSSSLPSDHNSQPLMEGSDENQQQQQQLTIFFNGRISVSDVTEFQARTILSLARKEMDDKQKSKVVKEEAGSVELQSQLHNGIAMKRSLQRFLQKRKLRIQSTSHPYGH